VFFDPEASGDLGHQGSGLDPGGGSPGAAPSPRAQPQQDLAEFALKLRRPGTKEYEGVDTSLEVSLNTLFFFCNRPTVAALITLGLDLSAAASAGQPDAGGGSSDDGAGGARQTAAAVDAGAMQAQGGEPEALQLLSSNGSSGGGGRGRTMFALNVTLRTLRVVLNYEGSGQAACSEACMQDFSFVLGIAPDGGMEITSALGNVTAVSLAATPGNSTQTFGRMPPCMHRSAFGRLYGRTRWCAVPLAPLIPLARDPDVLPSCANAPAPCSSTSRCPKATPTARSAA
jgi:hypothetical protein